jgi:ABC-type multidrug transport system ATPase subunit
MENGGYPTSYQWVWYGVAFLWGLYAVMLLLTTFVLNNVRAVEVKMPTLSEKDSDADASTAAAAATTVDSDCFKFEKANFSFKDIWYSVELPSGEELDLLRGVDGYIEAGTMTALMGSSGAGKTTLLDVLAGRKTVGTIKGTMTVNKLPKNDHTFRQIMGYVEQFDALYPNDTAREAVEFAAALRLKSSIDEAERLKWVDNILNMLELTPIEDMLVCGMSFEQRKRLCIAIELAANPSILFLDEPTSGLDSRAAQVTIRCLRRAAQSDRAIVCTIHQPSTYIFNNFDSLLLLKRGGQTVFFGELGNNCEELVSYFEEQGPHVPRIKHGQNPASWMLEVIGAGTTSGSSASHDYHLAYRQSDLCKANTAELNELSYDPNTAAADAEAQELDVLKWPIQVLETGGLCTSAVKHESESLYMSSNKMQAQWLFKRAFLSYWRNPSYNFLRMIISLSIALIFASVFAQQQYDTYVDCISRTAVVFLATLFCGIVGLNTVISVTMESRPAFYREQQSQMYNPMFYEIALGIVEIPYLMLCTLIFTVPFFFIVGFDHGGDESTLARFLWFWLFQYLYVTVMVYFGQFLGMVMPNEAAATGNVLFGIIIV